MNHREKSKYKPVLAFYLVSGIALCLAVSLALYEENQLNNRPNVLLIVVDTLRADRLGCYGHKADTSPTVDSLADQGVLFEKVYSQRSLTWPSVTSIMTSQYPAQHGVRDNGEEQSPDLTTIASVLSGEGYRTAAFLGNMLTGNHPGYEEKFPVPTVPTNCDRDVWITDRFIEWLDGKDDSKPFLVWMQYMAPHKPYEPPLAYEDIFDPDYTGKITGKAEVLDPITLNKTDLPTRDIEHVRALYDACIRFTDDQIKRVLNKLDEMGLADNTIVVLTADHGEELFERNHYFYHGCSMYDGCLHVPLIIRWPKGAWEGGLKVANVLESVDIPRTLLDLLEIKVPDSFRGKNLMADIQGSASDTRFAFAEWQDKMATIRTENWRYVWNPDGISPDGNPYNYVKDDRRLGYFVPREALYDRIGEPTEETNVLELHQSKAENLKKELMRWKASLPWEYVPGNRSIQAKKEMETLGYTGGGKKRGSK